MRTRRFYLGILAMAFLGSLLGNSSLSHQAAASVDSAMGGYRNGHSTICYVDTVLTNDGEPYLFAVGCPGDGFAYYDLRCPPKIGTECTSTATMKRVKVGDAFACTIRYWRGLSGARYGEREWHSCRNLTPRES